VEGADLPPTESNGRSTERIELVDYVPGIQRSNISAVRQTPAGVRQESLATDAQPLAKAARKAVRETKTQSSTEGAQPELPPAPADGSA